MSMIFANQVIDRVPYDVWYTIIKECVYLPSEETALSQRYHTHITPVRISHICKAWRSLALSIPLLWTRISLLIGDDSALERWTPHVKLIDLFLDRSGDSPLYVDLSIGKFDLTGRGEEHRFIRKLFGTAQRWKTAELELDVEWINNGAWRVWLDSVGQDVAPLGLLESLEIRVSAMEERYVVPFQFWGMKLPVELWTASPALTHLVISVRQLDPSGMEDDDIFPSDFVGWAMKSRIPYSQITHLLLEGGPSTHISWLDIGGIFSSAPNLAVCFIEGICADPPSTLFLPVILQHLVHLYLEASGLDGTFQSLTPGLNQLLTAPALKTLALAFGDNNWGEEEGAYPIEIGEWEQESYTQFITRSSCPLEELRLLNLEIFTHDLIMCLQLSPTLKVLHVKLQHDEIDFNEFFTRILQRQSDDNTSQPEQPNDFVLCPGLQELGLCQTDEMEESDLDGLGFSNDRFFALPLNESTGSSSTASGKCRVLGLPHPYYVKNADDGMNSVIQALLPVIRTSWRCNIISQYYWVLHTTRRSLWNRFRDEKVRG